MLIPIPNINSSIVAYSSKSHRKLLCNNKWDIESCVYIWNMYCGGWMFSERKRGQSPYSMEPC